MTTTPDYAGLIERLQSAYTAWNNPPSECLPDDAGCVLEAAQALPTLLESNAARERELDAAYAMQKRTAEVLNDWKSRAEAAEARVKQLERLTDGIDDDRRGALDLCLERNKQIAALEAERDRLAERVTELEKDTEARKDEAVERAELISAPEDEIIRPLCERIGYGAVMDSAARLWAKKDPMGAFYIGGCIGRRAALNKEGQGE